MMMISHEMNGGFWYRMVPGPRYAFREFTYRRAAVTIIVTLLLTSPAALFGQNFRATVQSFSGNVEVQLPGGRWQPAQVGMDLPVASQISTSFGAEAVLALGDPAIIRVRPLTRMRIEELIEREGAVESEMFLQVGRVRGEGSDTSTGIGELTTDPGSLIINVTFLRTWS